MSKEIKIVASSIEEFNEISEMLKRLPQGMTDIVEARQGLVGLECILKKSHIQNPCIFLPCGVNKIKKFDKFIGIYCGDYFFKADISNGEEYEYDFLGEGVRKE